MAKGYALLDTLEWLAIVDVDCRLMVLVLGDSWLVVDFVMRQAKPKVQALALTTEWLWLLKCLWGTRMAVQHIP